MKHQENFATALMNELVASALTYERGNGQSQGIAPVYFNEGGPNLPHLMAMHRNQPRHLRNLPNETAFAAAIGSQRQSGIPGIAMCTQSVGWNAGLSQAVAMAAKQGVPMIAMVAGLIENDVQGDGTHYGFQQNYDLRRISDGMNAGYMRVSASESPRDIVREIMHYIHTGGGRPIVLDVKLDEAQRPAKQNADNHIPHIDLPSLSEDDKHILHSMLGSEEAGNHMFVLGQAYHEATADNQKLKQRFEQMVKNHDYAVAVDSFAIGTFPYDHRSYVGLMGRLPTPKGKEIIDRFDGTRVLLGAVPDAVTTDEQRYGYWKEKPFIMVHEDKALLEHYQRIYPDTCIPVHASVESVIDEIKTIPVEKSYTRAALLRSSHSELSSLLATPAMNMYPENDVSEVTSAIAEVFGDESVNHVFGGGIVANGISYSLQHAGSSSMVVPHHTLGVAQNIAAGMHNVQTSGTTIAHVGDGDANYDFTGLQALGNDQANMIVMVYNNRRHLALAHGGQQRGYDASESIATSALPKTNFVKIAEGHGLNAVHVSAEGKEPFQTRLAATLAKAKQNPGITVVEVEMDPPLRIKHSGPALRT